MPGGLTGRINGLIKQLVRHNIAVKIISPFFYGKISSIKDLKYVPMKVRNYGLAPIVQTVGANKLFTMFPLSVYCFSTLLRDLLKEVSYGETIVVQFMDTISFLPAVFAKLTLHAVIIGDDLCFRYKQYRFPFNFLVKIYKSLVVKCSDIVTTSFRVDYVIMKRMRKEKKTLFIANGVEIKSREEIEYEKRIGKGISILHHLPKLSMAFSELKRVSAFRAVLLFMEPNLLNPVSAFGRKFFPMEAHTKGEKPFAFGYLRTALRLAGFAVEKYSASFFLAFPIARLLKVVKMKLPLWIVKVFSLFENVMERLPIVRRLNSHIVVLARVCFP